jgi:glycogen debranching enzyme
MKIRIYFLYLIIFNLVQICNSGVPPLVERIGIEVQDESREFAYTNKQTAFYYGETSSKNKSSWQGFNVFAHEFLEDYLIYADGVPVQKKNIKSVVVYPHQLKRRYKDGTLETVTLLDSLPVLTVVLKFSNSAQIKILPLFSDYKNLSDYVIDYVQGVLLIARKNHLQQTESQNYPVWLGIGLDQLTQINNDEFNDVADYSPVNISSIEKNRNIKIAIAVGNTKEETIELVRYSIANISMLIEKRANRMEELLQETLVKTSNQRFDQAIMWAKLSLDALIMNQVTKGIFAGLPWFNNYWGRDTFISLPGATLVTGNFDIARQILFSYAAYQEKNKRSLNYGRIPNIITTTHKSYNTADGTPRFIMSSYEYYKYSGDKDFIKNIFPVVARAIEGTLKYHCDKKYFLVHEDAETWMDAVGTDGPWSPRGNRANDIQSLWYQQILASAEFAKCLGKIKLYNTWKGIAEKLRRNFQKEFLSPENNFIYDHLNKDGKKDEQIRPNQIFCSKLLSDETRAKVLKNVVTNLTNTHGVASLNTYDNNFHPYHEYLPYYVKDEAYHNGVIWTWLSGAVISELCKFERQEMAYQLTSELVSKILEKGAVGTISELSDVVPRQGENEPRLSGTFSQAWSLAEFIRNIYQDYFGIGMDFEGKRIIKINPRIPKDMGNVNTRIKFGSESFSMSFKDGNQYKLSADKIVQSTVFEIELSTKENKITRINKTLNPNDELFIYIDTLNNVHAFPEDSEIRTDSKISFDYILNDMKFAIPETLTDYPVFHKKKHTMLTNSQIKKRNSNARLLCNVSDPEGDDKGNSNYKYPLNSNFVDGILDITNFKVSHDEENIYFELKFRKLVNPGWHPEYGFQLTYVAIAIDQDGLTNSGKLDVGMNSKYKLEPSEAYEKIIFVGGGVRVDDSSGKIIAEYVPIADDLKNTLGDISTSTIYFALPKKYIGDTNEQWQFNVLVGAQDDHGGAGLGEFRNVDNSVIEWSGGGKRNPNAPNFYDIIRILSKK